MSIRAPIGGTVAAVTMQEGETVAASLTAPTFLTVLDLNRLEVWAYVDEVDIGQIQRGQSAVFTVDAYPTEEFQAHVTAVYPKAEIRDNVVNYVAVLNYEPVQGATLRPEMTTNVQILSEEHRDVLTIPRRALRREQGRQTVLPVDGPPRTVTIGGHDDNYWEVTEGLKEGDEVWLGSVQSSPTATQ